MEEKKLNNEELENISGGIIVEKSDGGGGMNYWICDEKRNGALITCRSNSLLAAQIVARDFGRSAEVITPEEYEKRFKHPFNY